MSRQLLQRLKLRMLRAVDSVERHKSVLKAAAELGITQPALTRTLHEVEEIFGGRIFERHSRGMTVTPFGDVVCASVRRVLSQISRIDHDLDRFSAGDTRITRIGALMPAAVGIVPDLLIDLREQSPELHVQVIQGSMEELIPMLADGLVDVVVGRLFPPTEPDEFVRELLYFEPFYLIARTGHPLQANPKPTPQDIAAYRIVMPHMSKPVEKEVNVALSVLGLSGRVEIRDAPLPFLREILHTSDHLLISPSMSIAGDIKRGTLRCLDFKVPGPPRSAGVLFRNDVPLSMVTQMFIGALRVFLKKRFQTPAPGTNEFDTRTDGQMSGHQFPL